MIGYGFMGRAHSNAYAKVNHFFDLEYRPVLKAACARDKGKAEAFAKQWGYESIETDWKKLLARKDIDAVDICTPNNLHKEIAIAAAEAGKAILCEKPLAMPRFVLAELQAVADSADKLRRARGRRGLDILNRLRNNENVDLKIYDRELPEMDGQPVDMKLVLLAKHLEGKIVTGDYNLNKVARLHNVAVINLNDIANSLKPVFLPGESFAVRIVKPGEEIGQGVGYLDDGTMIVVEGGREHLGKEVKVNVTSVLQTSAGRMIFGKHVAA